MPTRQFDFRLILGFSGATLDLLLMESLEDLELTCELFVIDKMEQVLPLRLKVAARETYRQLSKGQRGDVEEIKRALVRAHGTDSFVAFDQFTKCHLRPGETVDEFWADLLRLALLVREMPPEC